MRPASDQSFAALRSMVVQHPGRFAFSTVGRVAASVLTALHPYFLAELVTSGDDPDRALRFLLLLVGSGIAHYLMWSGFDVFNSRWMIPLTDELKRIAFNTVWTNDYRSFVDHPSGKTASYVNDIRNHTALLWDSAHYAFLPMAASLPVYAVLLYRTSSTSAVGYLVFLAVAAGVMTTVARPVNARQHRLTDTVASNNGRVFDSFANFVNVFSFRAQHKEIERNDGEIDELVADDIRFNYALTAYWAVAAFLVRVLMWTAVLGYSWLQYDSGRITFTAFVVSVTVLMDFTNNYWNVVHNFGVWVDRSAAYREAYNYLFPGRNIVADWYRTDAAHRPEGVGAPVGLGQGLELRNLSFAYPDDPDRPVLNNISFSVARGEKVGIVGRSGEGKSTLIKILLGFYSPTSGQILVDGRPADPATLNRIQSYVPQDTSLFQESIAYNIAYADDHTPVAPDRIRDAATRANIDAFIDDLPAGYDTLVGERGIKLSLGQRQRIAIARAFLKPADLLILDEATSALDSETESLVQEALEHLWTDKAAIIIAHRLATLNNVDRIVVMENGRVVEEGTRNELLAAGGAFAGLWSLQRSGLV